MLAAAKHRRANAQSHAHNGGMRPVKQSAKTAIEALINDFHLQPECAWMLRSLPPDKQKLAARIDPSGQADASGYVAEELKKILWPKRGTPSRARPAAAFGLGAALGGQSMGDAGRMELECTMDEQDVVVLDTGSGFLKVGFSGEDAPRAVLPTAMATATADESREDEAAVTGDSAAQKKSQVFYGEEAILQENAQITRPVQRGEIQLTQPEKEAMENLLEHVFRNVLGVEQEDLPCLIADTMPLGQSSYATRQWIAEVMFEKIKVKSLAIFNTAALSLFSTGRTRGLVLESGEGITQAVPVFEGYAIPHAIFKMKVAGHDITQRLQSMMAEELGTKQSHHTMQAMKEKVCFVAPSGSGGVPADAPDSGDEEARSFELPDGQIIQVQEKIRTGATEILFGGDGEASMQKICLDAINTVDLDFRQDLVKSVVVAGGTSMLLNLAPRLRSELKSTLASELSKTVEVISGHHQAGVRRGEVRRAQPRGTEDLLRCGGVSPTVYGCRAENSA
eukprot:s4670_g2.t2